MAVQWFTPAEKRKLSKLRAKRAAPAPTVQSTATLDLKVTVDKRLHPLVDRMASHDVDYTTAPLAAFASLSDPLRVIVGQLTAQARTARDLTAALTAQCQLSASSAQREAYAAVSILVSCDRAKRTGRLVELK